jgi:UDP-N-acetylmuramyl pentapeptide phosphotransferase/UDP-N-acetylglucosamine-1-phosphate transferase
MYEVLLAAITAFLVTYISIPSIIKIAREKKLVDVPKGRKKHDRSTPALGGIAIVSGVMFAVIYWTPFNVFGDLQYILCAFVIIFLVGAKDDISPISPTYKLIAQLLVACILVFKSNIQIHSLYGLFGVHELPELVGILLTLFSIIVIINAFNLIDGINGLSASITAIVTSTIGLWFYLVGQMELAILAFSLLGALIAFLRYNVTPAKIFMGDTGSLFCGLVVSILILEFIDFHHMESPYNFDAVPAVAIGILILPLFDTLRVFIMRVLKGKSPLSPDRMHIHHLLIDSGVSHMQATGILALVNLIFIYVVIKLQYIGTFYLLLLIFALAIILTALLYYVAHFKAPVRKLN